MKLFCGPLSPLCTKVSMALGEKGLDYERIEVPYSMREGYGPRHPEVERINPKGQVPVLVDGELELYDSTVIVEYLEDRYSRTSPMRSPCGRRRPWAGPSRARSRTWARGSSASSSAPPSRGKSSGWAPIRPASARRRQTRASTPVQDARGRDEPICGVGAPRGRSPASP
jgi:glutathione S-transferase